MKSLCRNNLFIICFFIAVVAGTLASCTTATKPEEPNSQVIRPENLVRSPIVHDSLSKAQTEKIKEIHQTFSDVNPSTLSQTINNFKRDRNPDQEIAIWLAMADAYKKFTTRHGTLDVPTRQEAYKLILMRSMMEEEEARAKADLKLLSNEAVAEIFGYYKMAAKPITVEQR